MPEMHDDRFSGGWSGKAAGCVTQVVGWHGTGFLCNRGVTLLRHPVDNDVDNDDEGESVQGKHPFFVTGPVIGTSARFFFEFGGKRPHQTDISILHANR